MTEIQSHLPKFEPLELDRTGMKTEDLLNLRRHTIAMLRWVEAELIHRNTMKPESAKNSAFGAMPRF